MPELLRFDDFPDDGLSASCTAESSVVFCGDDKN